MLHIDKIYSIIIEATVLLHLEYADDTVLFSLSPQDSQEKVDCLTIQLARTGMKISTSKYTCLYGILKTKKLYKTIEKEN